MKKVYDHQRYYSDDEKAIVRKWAGRKTAEEIGMMIGRSRTSVANWMCNNKVSGKLTGENAVNAVMNDLTALAIKTLYDAGFGCKEIQMVIKGDHKYTTVKSIAYGDTRTYLEERRTTVLGQLSSSGDNSDPTNGT